MGAHTNGSGWIRRLGRCDLRIQLLLLLALHIAAIALFAAGFLLTKIELTNVSSCTAQSSTSPLDSPPQQHLERPAFPAACPTPLVQRTVWLIIDALRWDFVADNSSAGAPHMWHMPILHQLAAEAVRTLTGSLHTVPACTLHVHSVCLQGHAALLARFVADPPTTTMQRLRALLTVRAQLSFSVIQTPVTAT